jgi:hypothetical protein
MVIAPELEALDAALAAAQETSRGVLDEIERDRQWRGVHEDSVSAAMRKTVEGQKLIASLQQRSQDTPYAFIGLQVAHRLCSHRAGAKELLVGARNGG